MGQLLWSAPEKRTMSRHKHPERIDPRERALPPCGIDTHAHLDNEAFDEDREEVIARALACGLSHVANVFLDPVAFPERAKLFDAHPEVFFLLGVHPDDVGTFTDETLALIRHHVTHDARIRAIGEIGLDYSRTEDGGTPPEAQTAPFVAQLHLAKELGMPLAIHCRDAEAQTLEVLESEGFAGYPLIWHCFGGTPELARRLVDNDWYVSVPGTLTFKNNGQARQAVPLIPENRILVETDCPYLAPMPWRGTRNEPAYTVFTIRELARCRGVEPEAMWKTCGENARRFYRLDS